MAAIFPMDPYEQFHRYDTAVYLGQKRAGLLSCVDIDQVECCYHCKKIVALIERTRSSGPKSCGRTIDLARSHKVPAFLVRYRHDLSRFWITDLPYRNLTLAHTPWEYAQWLFDLRLAHWMNDGCLGAEYALGLPSDGYIPLAHRQPWSGPRSFRLDESPPYSLD